MSQPQQRSISVFDSLMRALSYITAWVLYLSVPLCLCRWLWRRFWASPLQETADWPVTPGLDSWPTLLGKKREKERERKRPFVHHYLNIWPLTYQHSNFLIISTPHRQLVCIFLCVRYLRAISEELRGRALWAFSSEKLQSFLLSYPEGGFLWLSQWYSDVKSTV